MAELLLTLIGSDLFVLDFVIELILFASPAKEEAKSKVRAHKRERARKRD